ncbi:MAG: hypothetical protein IPP77_06855 [Bacteroidetes bacterium]|nr:hypothetical protein [Bacteroidota bacterium]
MKKLNILTLSIFLTSGLLSSAGDCPSLYGKFTIGGSESADYSSIKEAAEALKCGGVSGPVSFSIEKGIYKERVLISSIPGASASNPITFESRSGNNTDVVIDYSTGDATVNLNGSSFLSFENLTIDHKAAVYGNCVRVDGNASNLRFKNVIFEGVEVARPGANNATVYFAANSPKTDIAFEDCEINNGSCGIYKGGVNEEMQDSKTRITGTLFFNQFESGLALTNEDAPVITNNVFSTLSSYVGFKAINLDNVNNNVILSNNIINAANGTYGLAMHNCQAQATHPAQISNNSIAVGGNGEAYGIHLSGNTDNQIINFNRVKLTINGKVQENQAYYKNVGSGNNVNMMNDLMYDLNTGGYTILGNTYKDMFNQLPGQSNPSLAVSANGIMIEKVSPMK